MPSAGTYQLFLDFQHEGVVRTAAFTVGTGKAAQAEEKESSDDHGH